MIKFFRKIRQKLLTENKFSKYLIYSIGEIVLVVVGILIALQINNWNEGRKDRIQEQVLLEQLHREYNSNLIQLDEKIEIRKRVINACSKLFKSIDEPELFQTDSLITQTGALGTAATFDPIVNDLISSGKLQLITNQRLKELLTLWTTEVVQLTEEEINYYEFRNNEYRSYIQEHFILRDIHDLMWSNSTFLSFLLDKSKGVDTSSSRSKHKINVASILNDPQFENIVTQCRTLAVICNLQSYTLRDRIEEILGIIEGEMKNKP